MDYSTIFTGGRVPNQVKEFVVDAKTDLDNIDISQLQSGSRAFVIEESQWYMLSITKRVWKPITWGSGGGSSGDIIYDGGEENGDGSTHESIYDGGEEG